MNTNDTKQKLNGIARFTGGGALLLTIIGLILLSPFAVNGQTAPYGHRDQEAGEVGGHHFGAVHAGPRPLGIGPEGHIAFLEIVLDLSASQVEEIDPILTEQHNKMEELRGKDGMRGRRDMRMKRMHRRDHCDIVDRTEMRANMRRQRREFRKDREAIRTSMERNRQELDEKLAKVLNDGQMEKYRKLRELREDRREERQKSREDRRERRGRKS